MNKLLIIYALLVCLVGCSNSENIPISTSESSIQTNSQECVIKTTVVQPTYTPNPTPTPKPILEAPIAPEPVVEDVVPPSEPIIESAPPIVVEQSGSVRGIIIDASSSTLVVQSEDGGQQYVFMYQSAEITGNIYVDAHVEVFYIGDINTTDLIDLYITRVVVYPT